MDRVTIPVTKSFSVQQDDIIGTLEIDESIADQIAAFAAEKLEMRLETSIQRKDGKWALHLVSFGSVPAENGCLVGDIMEIIKKTPNVHSFYMCHGEPHSEWTPDYDAMRKVIKHRLKLANDRLCRSSAEADGYGTQEQGGTK